MHPFSTLSITAVGTLLARVSISTTAPLPLAPDAAHQLGTQLQQAANLDKEPDTVLLCGTFNDMPTRADCFIFPLEGDAKVEEDEYSITRLHLQKGQANSAPHHQLRDIAPATATITTTLTTIPPYCLASLTSSVLSHTATLPIGPAMESAASAALASFASAAPIPAQVTVTLFATTITTADVGPLPVTTMASAGVKETPARNGTVSMTGTPTASTEPVTGGASAASAEGLVRMWLAVVGGLMVL